ncbi:hypothetical protein [Crystallibacter degradans]|uniref:hypothetical protein n=1 Tax=Crystallibacter degradans TaxID=2726743 RepID=UPI00147519B1|nr:hypothetical protein [Arthrobacter sp. SF27]NMR30478.1 hypothetical protein [Arthrobacter sp. SF27]
MNTSGTRDNLFREIDKRRRDIKTYLRRARPRRTRLTITSVVGSALVAALTAGPGFGQEGFTAAVARLFSLPDPSVVWQVICVLAALLSVASAVATGLANSNNVAAQITAAEACNIELEGLQTALRFGHLPLEDAVRMYQEYLSKVAFID